MLVVLLLLFVPCFASAISGIGGHEASASLSLLAQHGKELLHNIGESQSNNLTIPTRRLTNRIMLYLCYEQFSHIRLLILSNDNGYTLKWCKRWIYTKGFTDFVDG